MFVYITSIDILAVGTNAEIPMEIVVLIKLNALLIFVKPGLLLPHKYNIYYVIYL